MKRSTRTKTTFGVAAALLLIGAVASAQNLRVMGTTTGEGTAAFNNSLGVRGQITMTSPDSTNIYALALARTNENGRSHRWSWWHMNTAYGQDSLQLYEYQTDSAGVNCTGNTADGAMCAARLTIAKGGNVGIGVSAAAYKLDVAGDVYSSGWLRAAGGVTAGAGLLVGEGGLTVGAGGASPPPAGARFGGNVNVGQPPAGGFDAYYRLHVNGPVAAGGSENVFTNTTHAHSSRGNTAGFAAIENSQNYDTLMILGRSTPLGRKVDDWDYLRVNGGMQVTGAMQVNGAMQVDGTLKAAGAIAFYFCPVVTARCGLDKTCTYCGTFSLSSTCPYYVLGSPQTQACTLVGRLINP